MDILGASGSRRAKLKGSFYFFGTAAIAGILCNLLLFRVYSPTTYVPLRASPISGSVDAPPKCAAPAPIPPHPHKLEWEPLPERSVAQLRDLVATTKGFYARDWSLGLGWNNIRYILEGAILHAQLLNRTLIIPSFVYARGCEYDIYTCGSFARMVNRGDAIQSDEWRELPMERQMAWRIPIEIMIDIPHLRSIHPIIFVSEYLRLRGVKTNQERADGQWGDTNYHQNGHYTSNYTLHSSDYDPEEIVRVDNYEPGPWISTSTVGLRANEILRQRLMTLNTPQMALSEARTLISAIRNVSDPDTLLSVIQDAGWVVLHTWDGALGMDFVKCVVKPRIDVAPQDNIKGFVQDFANITEELFVLRGEIHLGRKPGSMRFLTLERARQFASLVLHDMRTTQAVQNLAGRLIHRIDSIVAGRLWIAAHMRRGDFVRHGWVMEYSIEAHLKRIKERVRKGYDTLHYLRNIKHSTFDVPNVKENELVHRREAPRNNDPFYLATDERNSTAIEYFRSNEAILFNDLLTLQDRRDFGWPLMFTDVAALVEQTIMGRGAAYFYGHGISSVVGGVVNMRAAAGWDPVTVLID